ncbi:hypothetical protein ONS95_002845 [Cadophora gregata]|uniref:uncharacterized protein n=1 Tax=Cadophora gregata TaxID=51156 RepID=UPI0026DC762E|nr:uncharacterized protein ONS95_002845 [Cadophora gregata]KAK0108020.1 hypothetical protein ONS95_002845 [Cadophora gregata]
MDKIIETLAHHAVHEAGHHAFKSSHTKHWTTQDEKQLAVNQWNVKFPYDDVISIHSSYTRKTPFFVELQYSVTEYWTARVDPTTKSIFCQKLSVRDCHMPCPGMNELHVPNFLLGGDDVVVAELMERDSRTGVIGTKMRTLLEVVMLAVCNGNASSFQLDNVGSGRQPLYRMCEKKSVIWDSSRKEWYQTMSLSKTAVRMCGSCLGKVKVLVDS